MSQPITETQSQVYLTSGNSTVANIPLPPRRNVPIRLYLYGATDPTNVPSTGVESYFITMRRSKVSTDEALISSLQPSGIVALNKSTSPYTVFVSGYEATPIGSIVVEHAPYFLNTGIVGILKNTTNPATGLIYPSGDFSYAPGYTYMFEYYEWEKDTYYWFYVGAKDKAGNATKFSQMYAHPQNPWSGMIPSTPIALPLEDTTPPSGMVFFY